MFSFSRTPHLSNAKLKKKKDKPHDKPVEVTKWNKHNQNQRCTQSNDDHSTKD